MRAVWRSLFVLLLVPALAGTSWADCVASGQAAAREACRQAMHQDCPTGEDMTMSCCSTDPGQEHDAVMAVVKTTVDAPALVHGPFGVFGVLPASQVRVLAATALAFEHETLKLPNKPAHVLLSALLI